MFISEVYMLQNNIKIEGGIITAVKLVVRAQYICSVQEITDWFWYQHPQQQFITVLAPTILNPRLDVIEITYATDIPKSVCNRTQTKQSISRHCIFLTDSDYD